MSFLFDEDRVGATRMRRRSRLIAADMGGQALERARLYARERESRAGARPDPAGRSALPRRHAEERGSGDLRARLRTTFGVGHRRCSGACGTTHSSCCAATRAREICPSAWRLPRRVPDACARPSSTLRVSFVPDVQDEALGEGLERDAPARPPLVAPDADRASAAARPSSSSSSPGTRVLPEPDPSTFALAAPLRRPGRFRARADGAAPRSGRGGVPRRGDPPAAGDHRRALPRRRPRPTSATRASSTRSNAVRSRGRLRRALAPGGRDRRRRVEHGLRRRRDRALGARSHSTRTSPSRGRSRAGRRSGRSRRGDGRRSPSARELDDQGWASLPLAHAGRASAGRCTSPSAAAELPETSGAGCRRWSRSARRPSSEAGSSTPSSSSAVRSDRLQSMTAALVERAHPRGRREGRRRRDRRGPRRRRDGARSRRSTIAGSLRTAGLARATRRRARRSLRRGLARRADARRTARCKRRVSAFYESLDDVRDRRSRTSPSLARRPRVVPLRPARGRAPREWLCSCRGPSLYALTRDERRFVEALAGQAAQALDRATHFESEQTIAETLQRSVLPVTLPRVEGVQLAARYLPGTAELDVGGDWFDAIPLPDGRLGLVVGRRRGEGRHRPRRRWRSSETRCARSRSTG